MCPKCFGDWMLPVWNSTEEFVRCNYCGVEFDDPVEPIIYVLAFRSEWRRRLDCKFVSIGGGRVLCRYVLPRLIDGILPDDVDAVCFAAFRESLLEACREEGMRAMRELR